MTSRSNYRFGVTALIAGMTFSAQAISDDRSSLIFLCPYEVLQEAYADLTSPDDALSLLAIERHVLAICRESQTALLEIHENNRRLSELFSPDIGEKRIGETTADNASGGRRASIEDQNVDPQEVPVFELVAITRPSGGDRVAIVKVDGVSHLLRLADRLESGHVVTSLDDHAVVLSGPDGTEARIE